VEKFKGQQDVHNHKSEGRDLHHWANGLAKEGRKEKDDDSQCCYEHDAYREFSGVSFWPGGNFQNFRNY
jgi:hypothetical protein